jgi:hypothetical protein
MMFFSCPTYPLIDGFQRCQKLKLARLSRKEGRKRKEQCETQREVGITLKKLPPHRGANKRDNIKVKIEAKIMKR